MRIHTMTSGQDGLQKQREMYVLTRHNTSYLGSCITLAILVWYWVSIHTASCTNYYAAGKSNAGVRSWAVGELSLYFSCTPSVAEGLRPALHWLGLLAVTVPEGEACIDRTY